MHRLKGAACNSNQRANTIAVDRLWSIHTHNADNTYLTIVLCRRWIMKRLTGASWSWVSSWIRWWTWICSRTGSTLQQGKLFVFIILRSRRCCETSMDTLRSLNTPITWKDQIINRSRPSIWKILRHTGRDSILHHGMLVVWHRKWIGSNSNETGKWCAQRLSPAWQSVGFTGLRQIADFLYCGWEMILFFLKNWFCDECPSWIKNTNNYFIHIWWTFAMATAYIKRKYC